MTDAKTMDGRRGSGRSGYPRRRRRLTPYERAARWFRKNFVAIAVSVILGLGIAAGSAATSAWLGFQARNTVRDYGRELSYAEYRVAGGDTMWDIAVDMAALNPEFQDVRQYLALLQKTNHIYGDHLEAGQVILVPYYATPAERSRDGDTLEETMIRTYEKYGIIDSEAWLSAVMSQLED